MYTIYSLKARMDIAHWREFIKDHMQTRTHGAFVRKTHIASFQQLVEFSQEGSGQPPELGQEGHDSGAYLSTWM